MEIVPSKDPGKKWEKKDFDLNAFLEERSDKLRKVRESRGIPMPTEDGDDEKKLGKKTNKKDTFDETEETAFVKESDSETAED
jgi:hypothetical protein